MPATSTPAEVILEFSSKQAPWMQDALRRVCLRRELTKEDYNELLVLLKANASGMSPDSGANTEPLHAEHFPARSDGAPQTVLVSIGDIAKTNRLAPKQTMVFAVDGITLVYGENGSGKSGYCRLLKKLCRVRNGAEEAVLGDVFIQAGKAPAQAQVRFLVGDGDVQDHVWTDGTNPPNELSRISVFDSRAAPIYADEESRMEVLPYLLDLLPRLGRVAQELEQRIDAELQSFDLKLRAPLETTFPGSEAARLIDHLQSNSSDSTIPTEVEIRAAATWSDASENELTQVEKDLGPDPVTRASNASTAAKSWFTLAEQLTAIDSQLAVTAIDALRSQILLRDQATAAATLVASETFSTEPLRGVGSDTWRQMFRYAREYSALAYPESDFPVTSPDSRCVLCQQEFRGDAGQRLRRFDEFVRNTASGEATRRVNAVQATARQIAELQVPIRTNLDQILTPRPELDAVITSRIIAYCDEAEQLKGLIRSALDGSDPLPQQCGVGTCPADDLRSAASQLATEGERLHELARDTTGRADRQDRRLQLVGMKSLAPLIETLLARRADLEARRTLRATKLLCDTRAISKTNTDLRRQFLTREFCARLTDELKFLGLGYLPVEVTDRSERGTNMIGVGLRTSLRIDNNRSVLSEGEFRGLALAAFFAEICGFDARHGIIIDDPVSSLDHRHRRQVAERIVAEAGKGRQVIVFTHDLAFFQEVQEEAASSIPQVRVTNHEVRVTAEKGCGTIFPNEEPWIAKKVEDRIKHLRKRLPELDGVPNRTSEPYRLLVKSIRTDIRETWERLVEEVLLNGVVGRFQPEVKTQNLKGVAVEDADHLRVYFEMTKASRSSGHDRAQGLQQADGTPDDLKREIDALAEYVKVIKERRKKIMTSREAQQEPPKGTILA